MIVDLLVQAGLGLFALLIVVAYFRKRLFRCPDCEFRSDHDHIVEASGEAPYCAYCGAHMDYVGRRTDAWKAKFTGEDLSPRAKAAEVEPEGVLRWLGR